MCVILVAGYHQIVEKAYQFVCNLKCGQTGIPAGHQITLDLIEVNVQGII